MSKFFIDFEFIEHAKQHKVLGFNVGYPTPTIDPISVGIVCDDDRTYYAINSECDLRAAWKDDFVRKYVLNIIFNELYEKHSHLLSLHGIDDNFDFKSVLALFKIYGKTREQIAKEIIEFVYPLEAWESILPHGKLNPIRNKLVINGVFYSVQDLLNISTVMLPKPVFYADFCSYDWVTLCQLFGRMTELPRGFPMYCNDLQQMLVSAGNPDTSHLKNPNPHHALHDAIYDRSLYDFIEEEMIKLKTKKTT